MADPLQPPAEQTQVFAAQRRRLPRRVSRKNRPRGWSFRTVDYAQRAVEHVLQGEMVVREEGREHRLGAGWTLLTFRGLAFELATPRQDCEAVAVFNSTVRVEPLNPRLIVLPPEPGLSRLAGDLLESVMAADRFQLDLTLAGGDHLAARAYHLAAGLFEQPRPSTAHWLRIAEQLIDSHADSDRPLAQILAAIPIARQRLLSLLGRRLGMSPRAYRIQRRVEAARQLLLLSGDGITSVAMQLGYSSSQHFATEFRRITGMTPSAFRAAGGAAARR